MNSCRDCVHAHWGYTGIEYAKCDKVLSPVDGSPDMYCSIYRSYNTGDYCGKEGKYFEPRPPAPPSALKQLQLRLVDIFKQHGTKVLRWLLTGKQKGIDNETERT